MPLLITVCLVVLRLSLYSSQSPWWSSDYSYAQHSLLDGTQTIAINISLLGGTQTIPIHITVILPGGTQTITIHIKCSLVALSISLYSSQSLWWHSDFPYTHHSLPSGSDNPYTHHRLPGSTQTIHVLITVCLVVLRLSLYTSQSPWRYSDYP